MTSDSSLYTKNKKSIFVTKTLCEELKWNVHFRTYQSIRNRKNGIEVVWSDLPDNHPYIGQLLQWAESISTQESGSPVAIFPLYGAEVGGVNPNKEG